MADTKETKNLNYLLGTTDAQKWAEEFATVVKDKEGFGLDDGLLLTWFANAIETGRMAAEKQTRQAVEDEHQRGIAAIGYISGELAGRCGAWDGNAPDWFPQPPEWLELWEEGYLHGFIEGDNGE